MASPYEHTPTRHTYDLSFVDDMPAVHPASRLIEEGDNAWRRNNSSFEEYMEDAPFPSHYSGLIGIIDDVIGYDARAMSAWIWRAVHKESHFVIC